jgi:prepilin-type N-terminal cleavage/methylation domain-containing protein
MSRPRRHAFTLIEMISVIVVLTVLGSLGAAILGEVGRQYRDNALIAELHTEASVALDRIVREVRSIPADSDAPVAGSADIRYATTTELRWGEAMHLRLSGTELEWSEDLATYQPLLTNVTDFELQFHDEDDAPLLTGPGDELLEGEDDTLGARRVSISITVSREGGSETLSTKVFLRAAMAGGV